MLLAKYVTNGITNQLRQLPSPLQKNYVNTFYCAHSLSILPEGDVISKYCKNRWCLVCNRIKTGKLINNYMKSLNEIKDKWFVTLTIPNVYGCELSEAIKLMGYEFIKMKDSLRKEGIIIKGIRKLEVTYNIDRDDYHPHYHLILSEKTTASAVVSSWLKRFKFMGISPAGQDMRPADERSFKEVFKYFTKLTTKKRFMNIEALDHIFVTLSGKRIFFTYKLKKEESVFEKKDIEESVTYWYDYNKYNWANYEEELFVDMTKDEVVKAVDNLSRSTPLNFSRDNSFQ